MPLDPLRPTFPHGLPRPTLQQLTRNVPRGAFPNNPWVAQLQLPRQPGMGQSRAGYSPRLSRGAWRGAGGIAALLAAQAVPHVIPGSGGVWERRLQDAAEGAALGSAFGAPGMAIGGLANGILGLV